jgi:hypothetical protein
VSKPTLKFILETGEQLDYESSTIKLQRIVEDLSDPSKRFGEFSYTFSLPKTKNNSRLWEFPDVKGRTAIFKGKSFGCTVYEGANKLLQGIIELKSFNSESYNCLFFSKYTQLLDELKGKKLNQIATLPVIEFEFERTIIDHINADYANSDETDYQFPLCFYRTFFMASATTESNGAGTEANAGTYFEYHYNYIESSLNFSEKNPLYYGQFPPAIYLVSLVKGVIEEAGWSLGGSFFQDPNIKKIILPFVGKPESYNASIYTGGTTTYLDLNRTLPEMDCTTFLKSVINLFNLYFIVDAEAKTIKFETYNTLFASNADAYDITDKIDASSVQVEDAENETSIYFEDDSTNNQLFGCDRVWNFYKIFDNEHNPIELLNLGDSIDPATTVPDTRYRYTAESRNAFWNKTTGDKKIQLNIAAPNVLSYAVLNERSLDNFASASQRYPTPWYSVTIPLISAQTKRDDKGFPFAPDSETTAASGNAVDEWSYEGGLRLYYYYGKASYNFPLTGTTFEYLLNPQVPYYDFTWIGIATGGTASVPTFKRVTIPIASPFKLMTNNEFNVMKAKLLANRYNTDFLSSVEIAETHGLASIYYCKATGSTDTTDFSLTLGDSDDYLFDNIYSRFHRKKYEQLRNGHILRADMICDSYDWNQLQIYRPVFYDGQYYQLVSIKNFDPVKKTAELTLLKKS